jgi:chemosensory pili system protein ChpA (sensor histidine kinase/response regulator)
VITEVAQAVLSPVTPIEPEALATETLAASAPQEIVESEALERVSSETVADLSANRAAPRLADAPLVEASSDSVSVRDLEPFSVRPESTPKEERQELARVDADLLDALLNGAGEVSIQRARLEQHLTGIDSNLSELSRVVSRLRDQLRKLEIETEAQVLHRYEDERRKDDFDPLEMDRYSTLQQYSRALAESALSRHRSANRRTC